MWVLRAVVPPFRVPISSSEGSTPPPVALHAGHARSGLQSGKALVAIPRQFFVHATGRSRSKVYKFKYELIN